MFSGRSTLGPCCELVAAACCAIPGSRGLGVYEENREAMIRLWKCPVQKISIVKGSGWGVVSAAREIKLLQEHFCLVLFKLMVVLGMLCRRHLSRNIRDTTTPPIRHHATSLDESNRDFI